MTVPELLLEAILRQFRLEGETVIRLRDGGTVCPSPRRKGYQQVSLETSDGIRRVVGFHRLKFALQHGYLPPRVDHRDRDKNNNLLSNLRAATLEQNQANSVYPAGAYGLPRGVRRRRSGRFQAFMKIKNRQVSLGTFDTVGEAELHAIAGRKAKYGEFYEPR